MKNHRPYPLADLIPLTAEKFPDYIGRDIILIFKGSAYLHPHASLDLLSRLHHEELYFIDLSQTFKKIVARIEPIPMNTFYFLVEGQIEEYVGLDVVIANRGQESVFLKQAKLDELSRFQTEQSIFLDFSGLVEDIKVSKSPAALPEALPNATGRDLILVNEDHGTFLKSARPEEINELWNDKSFMLDLTDVLQEVKPRMVFKHIHLITSLSPSELGRYNGRDLILVSPSRKSCLLRNAQEESILQYWDEDSFLIDITDYIEEIVV